MKLSALLLLVLALCQAAPARATESNINPGAWLGVSMQDLANRQVAPSAGVLVKRVFHGSPADDSGIRAGDALVELNGIPIQGTDHLRTLVGKMRPGSEVQIGAIRGGARRMFWVTLGDRPDSLGSLLAP